ncbi:isoleucine--tRNA ligase [Portibacter lacus]|uniref:Isoleucine--tRNA ligase n=1 Tax=Portibacter lacus TaxID=1099794 RepID=A0AA37SRZ6_9BACT|nr:isoleucine--tRNA ligase [Portibacter lacus]GLR18504.1 isoleucine--tRNA ligase [Portibacter lacus]
MTLYREYKGLNLPAIDQEILEFWEKEGIFKRSIDEKDENNTFVFYEGPPSANGKPGIHHVMARTVKDLFCRFQTMKGKRVDRKGGWDTHGLPVELKVESNLGITKEDIGTKITVEEYNRLCRETVMQFKDQWDDLTVKMGYWVDLDKPYITFENNYIESVWNILSELYNKGLIYKGYTIQPYSPAAGTGLSTHELNLPGCYQNVKDTSAVAMFKVEKDEKSATFFEEEDEDVRIIAWTTTPWTLPSNTGLTVGAKIDYVKVKCMSPYTDVPVSVILAKELVGKWFGGNNQPTIIEQSPSFKGVELEGIRYEQLLDFGNEIEELNGGTDAFKVILGDFVTTEDGTGIVHTAPSFGADDRRVGINNGLGTLTLVDKQGKFIDSVGEFSGRYVKNYKDDPDYVNVDVDLSIHLKMENKAFNVARYEHNYPHCWRTDKPILYYPLDSWFVKASAKKERMAELNKQINWKPDHTGSGRFGSWLENLQDWNLSRSRFWGIPLPIWRTEDGEQEKMIGSIAQLNAEIEKANEKLGLSQVAPKDLHRPFIDDVILVSDSGERMVRELDLIDVWFDSGSMPYAQWHYPFENEEVFNKNFPADFISEGVDQTRGWFYSLHAISTMIKDSYAFKNVVSTGLVLDKNGQKMSKRLGNSVDPFETLSQHGADAPRWYMMTNANPWDNLKFDIAGIDEVKRKFFGTLYNTYSFFSLYANIDKFSYAETSIPMEDRTEIDRWVISKLNSTIKFVDESFADYEPTKAGRAIQDFVENHLSNWYVRLCRRRYWKGEYESDKIAAYQTLYECLIAITKLMSPISPFFADWLYKNLNEVSGLESHPSVHLADFPQASDELIDLELEERMDYAQRISSLVLSLRKKEKIRVRQPLQKILLPVLNEGFKAQVEAVKDLILAEVNVKEIEYITDTDGVIKKKIKPNFKTLGRKLGKNMKAGGAIIMALGQEDIAKIESENAYLLSIGEDQYDLTLEDFEIVSEDIPGWQVANDRDLVVALDVTITEALGLEGLAREIVNRVQNMRKSSDFNVTDRINIGIAGSEVLSSVIEGHGAYIKAETLADAIELVESLEGEEDELNDGVMAVIKVSKS